MGLFPAIETSYEEWILLIRYFPMCYYIYLPKEGEEYSHNLFFQNLLQMN